MTAAIPTRLIVLLGAALAVAAALLVVRPMVMSSDEETTSPSAVQTPTPSPSAPNPATPAKPKLVLLPGLPKPLARELRYEKVVVVSLYSSKAGTDRSAANQAAVGAKSSGAGFVAMNVGNERIARAAHDLADTTSSPAVLVVKRPGKVVATFEGWVDQAVVAQAAHDAGARSR